MKMGKGKAKKTNYIKEMEGTTNKLTIANNKDIILYTSDRAITRNLITSFNHWTFMMLNDKILTPEEPYNIEIIRLERSPSEKKQALEEEISTLKELISFTNWTINVKFQELDDVVLEKISEHVGNKITDPYSYVNTRKENIFFLVILQEMDIVLSDYFFEIEKCHYSYKTHKCNPTLFISDYHQLNLVENTEVINSEYERQRERTEDKHEFYDENHIRIYISAKEEIEFIREKFIDFKRTMNSKKKEAALNIKIIRLFEINNWPSDPLKLEFEYNTFIEENLKNEIQPNWNLSVNWEMFTGWAHFDEKDRYMPYNWQEKRWNVLL